MLVIVVLLVSLIILVVYCISIEDKLKSQCELNRSIEKKCEAQKKEIKRAAENGRMWRSRPIKPVRHLDNVEDVGKRMYQSVVHSCGNSYGNGRGSNLHCSGGQSPLFHSTNLSGKLDFRMGAVLSEVEMSNKLTFDPDQTSLVFIPRSQKEGTCYANAIAAVIYQATRRVYQRVGGYPEFEDLRQYIITIYGTAGADCFKVLREVCPIHRLQCNEVYFPGALKAINCNRPIVAIFYLTEPEWAVFEGFFQRNPTGILSKEDINIDRRHPKEETTGHAVVLMRCNSEGLLLLNSWGTKFAEGGFFKIKNSDVLGLEFIDVFWTLNDLYQSEIDAYEEFGAPEAETLFNSLIKLHEATYECPIPSCSEMSKVSEFRVFAVQCRCPKCGKKFVIRNDRESLAHTLTPSVMRRSANKYI